MSLSFNHYIWRLPPYIGKEIFSFLIPDSSAITFRECYNNRVDNYSDKYEIAFMGDKMIQNAKGKYLSRIGKKNGKHRYYFTEEREERICDGCGSSRCRSEYCGRDETTYYLISKYAGKNIDACLLSLLVEI